MKNHSQFPRRQFLKTAIKSSAWVGLGLAGIDQLLAAENGSVIPSATPPQTGFQQQALPYGYDALEPVIDTKTMELHYSKHAAAYVKNLNESLVAEKADLSKSLEEILNSVSKYSMKTRNNGGGHYNHELFWKMMRAPQENNMPGDKLNKAIGETFGSFEEFKKQFSEAAKGRFGSGWAWLYADNGKKLRIGSTPNQDNPLMDISEIKGTPLLCLDVWEHAYYLKYQNRRPEYIENWWKLVNWDFVQQRYDSLA